MGERCNWHANSTSIIACGVLLQRSQFFIERWRRTKKPKVESTNTRDKAQMESPDVAISTSSTGLKIIPAVLEIFDWKTRESQGNMA